MIGRTISHYRITGQLGQGGMGVVYQAEDTRLGRIVAIKFLAPHLVEDGESRARFLREAKAAAVLDHPNICTVFEIDEADGQTFLVMALVEGRSVKEKIGERPLKLEEALDIAIQAARGLQAAHDKSVVHRDVKAANVMVNLQGQVKVMDFGLAQLAGGTKLTQTASMLGTPAYMAPEQAQRLPADRRSDIWALGVLLYEMVTGKLPFDGEREASVLHAIIHEEPEPVTALRSGLPRELDRIIAKALAKEPAQRYQHMDDFRVDLERLAVRSCSPVPAPRAIAGRARFPWRWVFGAGALGGMLAAGALFWVGGRTPKSSPDLRVRVLPLTSYRGRAGNPSFSPDGTQVAFNWDGGNGGPSDIYVKVVGAEEARRLTDSPEADFAPVWSPDGRWIAFLHGKNSELRLISPIGGVQRTLATSVSRPTWMPNSDAIIVVRLNASPGKPNHVEMVPLEGGEIRPLTEAPAGTAGERVAAVSPNGKKLAFQRCRTFSEDCRIYVQDFPKGNLKLVQELRVNSITWTPDSKELVLAGAGPWLVRVSADATPEVEPTPIVGATGGGPAFSRPGPDGKVRLAFHRGLARTSIWRSEVVHTPDAREPREPRQILASSGADISPFFSPDGKQILFASDRSGEFRLWLAGAEGADPVMLGSFRIDNHRWSTDGGKVVGDCHLRGIRGRAPCWMNVASRRPTRLPFPADLRSALPMLSTSSDAFYFTAEKGGEPGMWKAPVQGGEPRRLTESFAWPMFESPDGRHIYFGRQPPEQPVQALWRMPAGGGAEEKVLDAITVGTWSLTSKGFYFVDDAQVKFRPFTDGAVTSLAKLTKSQLSEEMTLSPDAKTLLTTRREDLGTSLFYIDDFK